MDFESVKNQLNDLPNTFKRLGENYTAYLNSLTAGIHGYTNASDAISDALVFDNATGIYLDVWGQIFGITRYNEESDTDYFNRIKSTLVRAKGTIPAILSYLMSSFSVSGEIVEDIPESVGWFLTVANPLSSDLYDKIIDAMTFVRPAGVPCKVFVNTDGFFLDTINYFGY